MEVVPGDFGAACAYILKKVKGVDAVAIPCFGSVLSESVDVAGEAAQRVVAVLVDAYS